MTVFWNCSAFLKTSPHYCFSYFCISIQHMMISKDNQGFTETLVLVVHGKIRSALELSGVSGSQRHCKDTWKRICFKLRGRWTRHWPRVWNCGAWCIYWVQGLPWLWRSPGPVPGPPGISAALGTTPAPPCARTVSEEGTWRRGRDRGRCMGTGERQTEPTHTRREREEGKN